ncbi:hypothetical protein F4803DRAFT_170935 [Xylaria telfairii]|nr:hypothetical protein F4803DRAFT_170935 [Xylaria telfairii]
MASPVKTTAPTSLDHRFGGENSLSAGLPMPGLSGRANSPIVDNQATSSKAPSTTTESSRTPPSWLASSLTSRPKSTSPPASAATSSWAYTKCSYHQQDPVPASQSDDNALITGLFFLGGSSDDKGNDDKGNEFQYGNIRVRLQTSNQGFVFGVGRGSVSILRTTLRFTLDFLDVKDEDFGLGRKNEGTDNKTDGNGVHGKRNENGNRGAGKQGEGCRSGDLDEQHLLSLSLTMTITIMAINPATALS